jgi:hypothetical protein
MVFLRAFACANVGLLKVKVLTEDDNKWFIDCILIVVNGSLLYIKACAKR